MTQNAVGTPPPRSSVPGTAPHGSGREQPVAPRRGAQERPVAPHGGTREQPGPGRLIGVDLARGLAVFGMYAAHVGPDPATTGGATGFLMELTHGRASALFAFLAGFSVVLMTGRRAPKTGRAGRQAVVKVVIRAVVLLALGTALTMSETPVEVILAFYGLYFLLVLPLYRLSARTLAEIAVVSALVLPQVLYVVAEAVYGGALGGGSTGPGAWPRTADGLVSLLFTGSYPALSWLPFVVAGMAVARLDLASAAVRVRLAVTGAGLAVLGYGGSWLALHHVPGVARALGAAGWQANGAGTAWWSDVAGWPEQSTPAWLFVAAPHSETTLSVVANTGVAIVVLVACLAAVDVLPRFRRLARPVIAVGSMSLTAYVLHIVAIRLLGMEELPGSSSPGYVLLGFVAGVTVFAALWSRFFRRGPLEALLQRATKVAERVR
ncbi:DUF418 domain-containing protein [Streptomyces sp. NPDC059063]|uniref:DUF418 domain-containing protein n=1 Tax=unclassified Streptomyces TaxID=2593676 RepID=UPI003682D0BE